MGFSIDLFQGPVDDELICPICMEVFDDPVQDEEEHIFCKGCINKWLETGHKCPLDRKLLQSHRLKPASRLVLNLLAKLHLKCSFEFCNHVTTLDQFKRHLTTCEYDTTKSVICKNGCGIPISLPLIQSHNCLEELKRINTKLLISNQALEKEKTEFILQIAKLNNLNKVAKIQQELRKPVGGVSSSLKSPQRNLNISAVVTRTSTLTRQSHQAPCITKKSRQWNPSTLLSDN